MTSYMDDELWQLIMQSDLGTEVCYYQQVQNYPELEYVQASTYALRMHCALHSLELWTSSQQNAGGQIVTTVRIKQPKAAVCAIIASKNLLMYTASKQVVVLVNGQLLANISESTLPR